MSGALREVFAEFGFKFTDLPKVSQANNAVTALTDSVQNLSRFLGASAVAYGFKRFIESQVESARQTYFMAQRLDMGTDELQRLQFAAEATGASAQDMAWGIRFLYRNIGEAERGSKGATQLFGELGLQLRDSAGKARPIADVLGDVADKLQKMPDQAKRVDYAVKLFGRNGAKMLQTLQGGRAGLQQLFAEFDEVGGGVREEDLRNITMFGVQLKKLELLWRRVSAEMMSGVLPTLQKWTTNLVIAIKYMELLGKNTMVWQSTLAAVGILFGLLVAPYAKFVALYLIFDDIFTLFAGGQSLIGETVDNLYGFNTAENWVKGVKDQLQEMGNALGFDVTNLREWGDYAVVLLATNLPKAILAAEVAWDSLKIAVEGVRLVINTAMADGEKLFNLYQRLPFIGNVEQTKQHNEEKWASDQRLSDYNKQYQNIIDDLTNSILDKDNAQAKLKGFSLPRMSYDKFGNVLVDGSPLSSTPRDNWVGTGTQVNITNYITTTDDPGAVGAAAEKGTKKGLNTHGVGNRNDHAAVGPAVQP